MSDTHNNHALNAPNIITAARFLLSIVIFILLPLQQYTLSLILFIIAAGTDWVDGYLARKYDQVTQLGRILDPFCDKIIICGTFTLLAVEMAKLQAPGKFIPDDALYVIQGWMAVVVVGREILVTALRGFIEQHGGRRRYAASSSNMAVISLPTCRGNSKWCFSVVRSSGHY